jgi:hypothetical protein
LGSDLTFSGFFVLAPFLLPSETGKIYVRRQANMARPLRIQFGGAFYHIISRGNERKRNAWGQGVNCSIALTHVGFL